MTIVHGTAGGDVPESDAEGRPQIQLNGVRAAGGVRCALLVLHGANARELGRASALAALLADRCVLVAVDGGWGTCRAARRRPDLYVGDGDSVRAIPAGLPAIVLPKDKDFSDMAGALREMRRRRVHVVVVAGLLGGRVDHEWANLLEAGAASRHFAGILAPTQRGLVVLTSRGCRAVTVPGRTLSLFAPCGRATVSLRGTHWKLVRRRVEPGSLGLSNITGTRLHLVVHAGAAALVFPR